MESPLASGLSAIQFVANLGLFLMWVLFWNALLERRFDRWITFGAWGVAFVVWITVGVSFPLNSAVRFLVGPSIQLLVAFALYKSRWAHILFAVFATQALMVTSELILVLLFPELGQIQSTVAELTPQTLITIMLIDLPLNAALLWLASLLFNQYKNRLSAREWLLYALFPISQFVGICSWVILLFTGMSTRATIFQVITILFYVVADAALYFAMRGMAQRAELRVQNELLAKQIDAQKEHYSALTEQYESIRRMRHDIDNHLHTMHILLENGQTSEAAAYSVEVQAQSAYKSSLGKCQNPVVDAFLYQRIEELRKQGIEVAAQVSLPADTGVSNADLVSAFGNLLNNASEAQGSIQEKRIAIEAHTANNYLIIKTENPLRELGAGGKLRRIPELDRGVGFHIFEELAKKYEGEFTYSASDNVFRTSLTLKGATIDAAYSNL